MCGPGGIRLTRCGVICGLAALAALSTALLGPTWLHTEEKLVLPNLPRSFANVVSVRFKLGLFRVCPKIVKPSNFTIREYTHTMTIILSSFLSFLQRILPRFRDFKGAVFGASESSRDRNIIPRHSIYDGSVKNCVLQFREKETSPYN